MTKGIYTVVTKDLNILYQGDNLQKAYKTFENSEAFQILYQKDKDKSFHNISDLALVYFDQLTF